MALETTLALLEKEVAWLVYCFRSGRETDRERAIRLNHLALVSRSRDTRPIYSAEGRLDDLTQEIKTWRERLEQNRVGMMTPESG